MRKLEKFHGSRELAFEQITPEYLTSFENYLVGERVNRRKDNSNYAHAVIKTIRRIFIRVSRKGISYNPFRDFEMPEYTPGDKDHLTLSELDKWTSFTKRLMIHF